MKSTTNKDSSKFYEGLKIKFADYIISKMDKVTRFPVFEMIDNKSIKEIEPTITPEQEEKFNSEYKNEVSTFLINEDLITRVNNDHPDNTIYFILSPMGKDVKKRGGYNNLIEFEKGMEEVSYKTLKWAKVAGITGIIAIILAGYSELKECHYSKNMRQREIPINPKDSAILHTSK